MILLQFFYFAFILIKGTEAVNIALDSYIKFYYYNISDIFYKTFKWSSYYSNFIFLISRSISEKGVSN